MGWWSRLLGRKSEAELRGARYRVAFIVYSPDGDRAAQVLHFAHGEAFLRECERIDGAYVARHGGRLVGPFGSPEAAERYIVATPWFTGEG